jgi:hypothetical protein
MVLVEAWEMAGGWGSGIDITKKLAGISNSNSSMWVGELKRPSV